MILAIVNQKGGVGKTTTAVTLASGLAREGHKTLLVDLDSQGNVADTLGLRKEPGVYRLIVAKMPWRDVVVNGGLQRERDLLHVIPGDKHTVEAKQYLATMTFRERAVAQALGPIQREYSFVILDLAPSMDVLHVAALVAADAFLIPTRLDHLAVIGVNDALLTLATLKQGGVEPPAFLGVLATFWDRTTRETEYQLEHLTRTFGEKVWPPIPTDTKAREAPAHGQTLWEYAPDCRALKGVWLAQQWVGGYEQALRRLLGEVGR